MEPLISLIISASTVSGVFLTLRGRIFPVVLGLMFLSYAVNIFLFSMGRLVPGLPAIIDDTQAGYADPLPQALVLTAIVISFGMSAFLIALALKLYSYMGNDHVDGEQLPSDEQLSVLTRYKKKKGRNKS